MNVINIRMEIELYKIFILYVIFFFKCLKEFKCPVLEQSFGHLACATGRL